VPPETRSVQRRTGRLRSERVRLYHELYSLRPGLLADEE
jgi:hypothetical protein